MENEKKIAQYANAFTFTLNPQTNEALLVFSQRQPLYNSKEHAFNVEEESVVTNLVLPYSLLLELSHKVIEVDSSTGKGEND